MNAKGKMALLVLVGACFILGTTKFLRGDSVYVINDTVFKKIKAYKIEGTNLVDQDAEYDCKTETFYPEGAVGLAIDANNEFLFVTFEGVNQIELVNTNSMQKVDIITAPQASDLAGIVMDQGKEKVYTVDRRTNHLYVYSWDAEKLELTLDLPDPYYIELEDCLWAHGIALDEDNNRLYVADNTTAVKYYDSNDPDWSKLGQFTVSHHAIGIAVDGENQYVYTGNGMGIGNGTYLSQYDLNANPNDAETTIDIGSPVLGIAVDQQTSLIYLTTYQTGDPNSQDRLLVYDPNISDPNFARLWSSSVLGSPAGVAVASGVGYKPPSIEVRKYDDVDPNVSDCVEPNDTITYFIYYTPAQNDEPNVILVDILPAGVTFLSAYPNDGEYNDNTHRYTWELGTVTGHDPNDPNNYDECLQLEVLVNTQANPGDKLTNIAQIEGDNSYDKAIRLTNICCWGGDLLYVDINASGYETGQSWTNAYTDLQDALVTADNCLCDEIWVAQGTYMPDVADASVSFELIDSVDLYGGFVGDETTLDQRNNTLNNMLNNPAILNGDIPGTNNTDKVVKGYGLDETTIFDGFIVAGGDYGIHLQDCDGMAVSHCVVKGNSDDGIYCKNTDDLSIKNNLIYENGSEGIYLYSPDVAAVIRNNTIADNDDYGIRRYLGVDPDVSNCVIWDNEDGATDNCDTISFCCLTDPNDPNGIDPNAIYPDGDGNITANPLFVDDPNDDYHIDPTNSPCLEAGDPSANYAGELDIDGFERLAASGDASAVVDIGADEVVYPDCWNFPCFCYADGASLPGSPYYGLPDGFVNTDDWPPFRDSFQKSYPDPDYNPCGDWNRDGTVNTDDWPAFRDNYQTAPPTDCPRGGVWPPDQQKGSGAPDPDYIEEMIDWLEKYQPPGWKQFIELLKKLF